MLSLDERVSVLEANQKNIFHQLDEQKKELDDNRKLLYSIEAIATKTEVIEKKVDGIDNRLSTVERSPAEEAKILRRTVVACVVTSVISLLIGAFFALVLK